MEQRDRWAILDAAPPAEEATLTQHFSAFVASFVEQVRRERWLHFLLNRPRQVFKNGRNLYGCLDERRYSPLKDPSQLQHKGQGVFYGFIDEPVLLTLEEAVVAGYYRDAIFSMIPGKKAIFFSHEGDIVLCEC